MYATQDDMISRFGALEMAQRTDREAGQTLDTAILNQALQDAADEMDSYLAARYQMPLSGTPTVLVRLNCDIARYLLWSDQLPETIKSRYDAAVALLKAIAAGKATLGLDATDTPAPVEGGVTASESRRSFTPESMRGAVFTGWL